MRDQLNPIHCVVGNLQQVARAVSRVYAEEMRSCGVKRSQFNILAVLMHTESITLSDFAERLFMERTTLSRNLKPLVKQGYVSVILSASDARVREISLTRKGIKKFREALELWRKAQKKLLRIYGEENWRKLEASLHKLRDLVA